MLTPCLSFENSPKVLVMNSPTSVPLKSSKTVKHWEDPVVREVRDARHRLAARFDNDLERVAGDLMLRQADHGSRLVNHPPLRKGEK